MANIKIKPSEGVDFKQFEIEIEEIDWKKRCALNDKMINQRETGETPLFSFWGEIVLQFTKLTESELNKYSTNEIVSIANTIFAVANKKK